MKGISHPRMCVQSGVGGIGVSQHSGLHVVAAPPRVVVVDKATLPWDSCQEFVGGRVIYHNTEDPGVDGVSGDSVEIQSRNHLVVPTKAGLAS